MPFGNITTLYLPVDANAGASQWGTDVRKLLSAADAASSATTVTDHSTGGAVIRTEDPYSTSTADGVEANFGWAVTPADMGGATGARRYFPAGNHVATIRMGHNGALAVDGTLTMFVYRVGVGPGRARTLLGSGSATASFPVTSGQVTFTVTVALPEVVFEPDETIQYGYELNSAGVVLTGRTCTLFTGTTSAVASRVVTPGLRVLADTTGAAAAVAAVDGVSGKVLGTAGASAGVGTVSGAMSSRWDTTGVSSAAATVTGSGGSVATTTGEVVAAATVSGAMSSRWDATGTAAGAGVVDGAGSARADMTGTATGAATVDGAMSSRWDAIGSSAGAATVTATASSVAGAVGAAVGAATVQGQSSVVLGTVGTVAVGTGGGETIVVKKPVYMFGGG